MMTVASAVGAGTRLRAVSRVLGWVLALALCAFAVTSSSGPLEVPSAGTSPSVGVAHDLVVGFGEHHAAETRDAGGLHARPALRSRALLLAVLAVGVVVVALVRRELLRRERAVVPEFRLVGLRSGRGPPLAPTV
jgi:hypothetical protein